MSGPWQSVSWQRASWQRAMAALATPDQRTLFVQSVCGTGTDGRGSLPATLRRHLVDPGLFGRSVTGERQCLLPRPVEAAGR